MKEWWNNLALREKQMLTLGALALFITLFYLFIWSPIDETTAALRKQIRSNQELLTWMENADQKLQALAKAPAQTVPAEGSLLSIVQKQINQTPFVSALTQLHQGENDSVQLTFQKVNFDKLIAWLTQLVQENGLVISQLTVIPTDKPGITGVDLVINKQK